MMKKVLSRLLLALNALLILFLLLLSGVMVYMTAAKPAEIFGHTAVLLEDSSGSGTLCIVDRHPAQLVPEDTLLLRSEEGALGLLSVDRNDGKLLYYKDEGGAQATLPVDDERIQGRVTAENDLLGSFFSVILRSENVTTTYICIGTGFLFCVLAVFLIYFISGKLAVPFAETQEDLELLQELRALQEGDIDEEPEEPDGGGVFPKPLNAAEGTPVGAPFPQLAKLGSRHTALFPQSTGPMRPVAPASAAGQESPPPVPRQPLEAPPSRAEQPEPSVSEAESYSILLSGPPDQRPAEEPLPPGSVPIDLDETVEIKIYTPHSLTKSPSSPEAIPPEAAPTPVPPEPESAPYDLYDLTPNIDELLNEIEREFRELNENK